MSKEELEFLKSLPRDGTNRVLRKSEYQIAWKLREEKLVFVVSGIWPEILASITFAGRKALSRE